MELYNTINTTALLLSLLPLVDHDIALAKANELRHCLLHVQILDLVPKNVQQYQKEEKRYHEQ